MIDFSYEILDLLKKYDGNTDAALAGERDPKCLYAFSPLRENLFEWVEFKKEDRVLQIGSDYGSCTGLLGARAGQVVVLDSRDENLEVNRLRHQECKNIRYIRGELLDEPGVAEQKVWKEYKPQNGGSPEEAVSSARELMSQPFDYVLLPGGFEQVKKEAAWTLLEAASGHVKPGGFLMAPAENEAGVRYWMGAVPYETSFLEAELRQLFGALCKRQGGSFLMYYPVPDYRYPITLYSDAYLPKTGDVLNVDARLEKPGFWFGNENEVMAKACQNGEFTKFANSFLGGWEKGSL